MASHVMRWQAMCRGRIQRPVGVAAAAQHQLAASMRPVLTSATPSRRLLPTSVAQARRRSLRAQSGLKEPDSTPSTSTVVKSPSSDEESTATASLDATPSAAAAGASVAVADDDMPSPWKWEESSDAVRAYGVLAAVLLLGCLPDNPILHRSDNSDLLYFISLAVCTQYIGAHKSLTTRSRQQLSIKEGLLAPVLASVSLFTCYLIIRFLPDLSLATLLNCYFWLLGSFAGVGALLPLLRQVGGPLGQVSLSFQVPDGWLADEDGKPVQKAELAPTDLLATAGGVGLASAWFITQNYNLNNAMACLIASDILQLIGIRSFRVAGALLVGLLLYDVFWVFGSPDVVGDNVMLAVATSDMVTGPSRLLFPREAGGVGEAADYPFSLLGLGDIAVPGLLACLALRFDASRCVDMAGRARVVAAAVTDALQALPKGDDTSAKQMGDVAADAAFTAYDEFADRETTQREATLAPPPADGPAVGVNYPTAAVLQQRTYFTPIMAAYVAGLLMAFAANSITHLGQPALLYIVPSTLGMLLLVGASRGELDKLWSFTDVPTFGMPKNSKEDPAQPSA